MASRQCGPSQTAANNRSNATIFQCGSASLTCLSIGRRNLRQRSNKPFECRQFANAKQLRQTKVGAATDRTKHGGTHAGRSREGAPAGMHSVIGRCQPPMP
jgi:hypothetical protein